MIATAVTETTVAAMAVVVGNPGPHGVSEEKAFPSKLMWQCVFSCRNVHGTWPLKWLLSKPKYLQGFHHNNGASHTRTLTHCRRGAGIHNTTTEMGGGRTHDRFCKIPRELGSGPLS